ncbi:hypothetical protein PN441_00445 [Spirulina major CS-329]|jgi:hypothetical protein|uniref:Tic20 family protein n=1 Tax=Spirulina TaxID=1154 RepID=UPI00232DD050|nr:MULTISPECIES: Tic20 family protein [Spirulina]MDB9495939.1 hypothetical protein [Spirulina subsalsa CS-330]MDB9501523.1 hypothetical protein [Spirulina major CS-329]
MNWRGATTRQDRIFAALVYLIPILEVAMLGFFLASLFPPLGLLLIGLTPLMQVYFFNVGGLPLVELGLFFGLFILVVRNSQVSHFLRFNTVQAILLSIFTFLCRLVLDVLELSSGLSAPLLRPTGANPTAWLGGGLESLLFLAVLTAAIFAIAQSLRGQYADLPIISEAAYNQVRY